MRQRIQREPTHLLRGRISQSVRDPAMRNFMKDDRNENGRRQDRDCEDRLFQGRVEGVAFLTPIRYAPQKHKHEWLKKCCLKRSRDAAT